MTKLSSEPETIPAFSVDLGTVDAGDAKTLTASMPADERLRAVFDRTTTIRPNSDVMDLYWTGSGPGYLRLGGATRHVANCDGFETTASVIKDGKQVATLALKARVRRAFRIEPITEGSRYAIEMAEGVELPSVVDHSSGLEASFKRTGAKSAELVVVRTKACLIPGGMIRLIDRKSRDSQVIPLPLPSVPVSSSSVGQVIEHDGTMNVSANSSLTPDKKDVEVVLDPPGAYKIVTRGYENGKLTLKLRAATRSPQDLTIGYRSRGAWAEIARFMVGSAE